MSSGEPDELDLERMQVEVEWLRGLARRLIADPSGADDAVQEAWLAALSSNDARRPPPRAWLAGTLRNVIRFTRRRDSRRAERERRAARPEAHSTPVWHHGSGLDDPSVEDLALMGHRRLVDAVLALPEPQRRVLVLRYWRDLTPAEIAVRLGEPVAAVKGRLRRALAHLRGRVVDDGDGRGSGVASLIAFIDVGATARLSHTSSSLFVTALMAKNIALVALVLTALAVLALRFRGPERPESSAIAGVEVTAPTLAAPPFVTAPDVARTAVVTTEQPVWNVDRVRDLHGLVLGPDELPQVDALVSVHATHRGAPLGAWVNDDTAPPVVAKTRTDALGRYSIGLDLGQLYNVVAEAAGLGRATATWRAAGERVDLRLAEPRTISGHVQLVGVPVPAARVTIGPNAMPYSIGYAFVMQEVETDGSGYYAFRGLAPGSYFLDVEAEDLVSPTPQRIDVRSEDVDHEIALERGRVVRGRVVDADSGHPVAGCKVTVGILGCTTSTETGVLGEFELRAVMTRRVTHSEGGLYLLLVAESPGHIVATVPLDFLPPDTAPQEVVVELTRGATIRGRICVGNGDPPPAGTRVYAYTASRRSPPLAWRQRRAGRTMDDGRFELSGLAAQLASIPAVYESRDAVDRPQTALRVEAPGYASMVWILPRLQGGAAPEDIGSLSLPSPASIGGRVVDRAGAPVAHAMVTLSSSVAWLGAVEPEDRGLNPMVVGDLTAVLLETDDLGRFHRQGLPPGEVVIRASLWNARSTTEERVQLAEGQVLTDVELALELAGSVAGRVVDDDGRVMPFALVAVTGAAGRDFVARADSEGVFRAHGLNSGHVGLLVWEPPSEGRTVPPHIPTTVEAVAVGTDDLTVVLRVASTVRGSVCDADGAPVPYAKVRFVFASGHESIEVGADAEGRFERDLPRGETAEVWVTRPHLDTSKERPSPVRLHMSWVVDETPLELTL